MQKNENQEIVSEQQGKKKMNLYLKIMLATAAALLVFFIGFEVGRQNGAANLENEIPIEKAIIKNGKNDVTKELDFSLFWSVWDLLKNKFVDSENLDAKKLFYGAIKGMLSATGDPYTTFLDPEDNKKFSEDITGSFEGIGAELGVKNGLLTVIAPLEGTPAEKAGLRAGDKIIRIDGKTAADMSIEDAVSLIRGQKGTEVTLSIFRNGDQEAHDIKVQRNVINVKSVKLEFKENGIAMIEITRFGEDTNKEFALAINKVAAQKSKGLIIDLRNNPGGYLDSSIQVASKLLPKGKVVVIEEDAKKKQEKMLTQGGDIASGIETIVLINEGSASASEILAGALKDNRSNVTLLGKKSFGKGSVQELIPLSQGTAVKITVARWLTPNGAQINEQGIKPDMEVELTNDDYQNDRDPQLDEAIRVLKEKIAQIK